MSLKLTYFNAPGRAFVARVCFKVGNIPFEDETISFPELQAAREATPDRFPLGQMPVLTLPSGQVIAQSNAIARYAGKLSGLYPVENAELMIQVDEIVETTNECMGKVPQHKDPEEKKKLREAFLQTDLPKYFGFFAKRCANGYTVGGKLSIADLSLYAMLKAIRSGTWDHIPADADKAFPALQQFMDTLDADPVFAPHKLP
jgi:glutathione S-transferase